MLKFESSVESNARHLERAQREMLQVRRDPSDPSIAWVSSATKANHWYRVTRTSCSCPARGLCKHMAIATHMAIAGLIPFTNAGETVSSEKPSLRTRVQAGWQQRTPQVEVNHTPGGEWFNGHDAPRTAIFVDGEERFQVRGHDFAVQASRCRFGRHLQAMTIAASTHVGAVTEILAGIGIADTAHLLLEQSGISIEHLAIAS